MKSRHQLCPAGFATALWKSSTSGPRLSPPTSLVPTQLLAAVHRSSAGDIAVIASPEMIESKCSLSAGGKLRGMNGPFLIQMSAVLTNEFAPAVFFFFNE